MKIPYLLFFLLFSQVLVAQDPDWMRADGSLEGFVVGNKYFTFVSDANLRDKPSTQSNVLTTLPIGTHVEILVRDEATYSQRGVTLPWVKIKVLTSDKREQEGYLWGGFLALASIQTPMNEYTPNAGVQYLTGVSAYDQAQHEISVQVRIAKEGKELSKCEFKTNGDLSYYPEFSVAFEPFQKVKAVLSVNYYYPACGYPSGDNLLFWQENNLLTKVLETSSVSDAGVFYAAETYILPTQRGGIGDHVLVTRDVSEYEEKGDDYVRTKQELGLVLYKWNGGKLVKVRELK
jgi:Bacterial SH3 domain